MIFVRKRKPFDGSVDEIKLAMRQALGSSEYRRIQCVYLAIIYPDMPTNKIAEITLFTTRQVWGICAYYRENGLGGLGDKRGGRYRENLTIDQEIELLKPFEQECPSGSLVVAGRIKAAHEAKVGREVAESTIYRMLARHGFRKITPYRRHKKANKEEQETFKKTLPI